jgi:hypothetical protein
VYIADFYNHRIRKVTVATGIVSTFAGTGTSSYSGDNGDATSAALYQPRAVAIDASGTYLPTLQQSVYSDQLNFSLLPSRQRVHR